MIPPLELDADALAERLAYLQRVRLLAERLGVEPANHVPSIGIHDGEGHCYDFLELMTALLDRVDEKSA